MFFIGCAMLTIFVLLHNRMKSIFKNYDQERIITDALNYPLEDGKPYYVTATSRTSINVFSLFATVINYLMLVIGAFFFGGGLIV